MFSRIVQVVIIYLQLCWSVGREMMSNHLFDFTCYGSELGSAGYWWAKHQCARHRRCHLFRRVRVSAAVRGTDRAPVNSQGNALVQGGAGNGNSSYTNTHETCFGWCSSCIKALSWNISRLLVCVTLVVDAMGDTCAIETPGPFRRP